jgi:hypothetical protein
MSVVLDFGEPTRHDEVRIDADGVLSFALEGQRNVPVSAHLETTYERAGKHPKVVHRTPLDPAAPNVHPDLALERFDFLAAIDTNTEQRDDESISVACLVKCDFHDHGRRVGVVWEPRQIFEFRDATEPPERIGWRVFLEHLSADERFAGVRSAGIVVDSDFGRLTDLNARRSPISGDFYLPERCELLYASADTGSEFVANRMLSRADQVAGDFLKRVLAREIPDDGLKTAEGYPFSRYRSWVPSRAAREPSAVDTAAPTDG